MNIIPNERPNPTADRIAAATVATIEQWPSLYRRVTALIAGPAFDALDKAFAANLESLRAELNLMGATILQLATEKEAAELEARNLELRVEELRGGDDTLNAVRSMFLDRAKRIDVQFAESRDECKRIKAELAATTKLYDEAVRERTGAARYIVELEDRVRTLENAEGAA